VTADFLTGAARQSLPPGAPFASAFGPG
jgi:hypothetical protein